MDLIVCFLGLSVIIMGFLPTQARVELIVAQPTTSVIPYYRRPWLPSRHLEHPQPFGPWGRKKKAAWRRAGVRLARGGDLAPNRQPTGRLGSAMFRTKYMQTR